jgi:hypothetical protein
MRRLCAGRGPRLLAVFSYRYDWRLVPDLLTNLDPLVDGWVAWDDRNSKEPFSGEPERRHLLLSRARQLGAKWVLTIDPDERLERGAAPVLRRMTENADRILWRFRLRELYAPTTYRVDGIWGKKQLVRLFPLLDGQIFSMRPLHGPAYPLEPGYKKLNSGLNIYHLKMITERRRKARRDLYKQMDPSNSFQAIGYDYLADDENAEFEAIPPGREYLPGHRDDGELWMADVRAVTPARSSPGT